MNIEVEIEANSSPRFAKSSSRSNFLQEGTPIWIPCETHVWRAGVIAASDDGHTVWVDIQHGSQHELIAIDTTADGPRGRPPYMMRSAELCDVEGAKAIEDLGALPMLAEPEVLHSLRMRYASQNIYTFAGPMLLAVNPHETIPGFYDNEQLSKFASIPRGCLPPMPHIFGTARDAFLGIQHSDMSQTVLVSGESGAGKTETAKLVIRFLALAGGRKPEPDEITMDQHVLQSVPLLEALGNARTLKNDNSSRFGKFIEMRFKHVPGALGPCIMDALTHTYLLETVRVTELSEGERCFHIFYQILAAASRGRSLIDKADARSCDVSTCSDMEVPRRSCDLRGTWRYSSTSSYKLSARGADYFIEQRSTDGRMIEGLLRQDGEWHHGLVSKDSEDWGHVRVRLQNGRCLSNFRKSIGDVWGADVFAELDHSNHEQEMLHDSAKSKASSFTSSSTTASFTSNSSDLASMMKRRGKRFFSSKYQCGFSNVEWDEKKHYWVVTWTRHGKERTKSFSPSKFLEPGMRADDADAAARKAAINYRNSLVARGKLKVPPLPLSPALPGFALPDCCEWTPREFDFLERSNQTVLPGADDATQFDRTVEAMQTLRIPDDEIAQLISIIVAVLHLGNIKFQCPAGNSEGAEVQVADDRTSPLELASALLSVESKSLAKTLCTREIHVGEQVIRKCRTTFQAAACRDAFARHLYGMVFAFVVSRINQALSGHDTSADGNLHQTCKPLPTIGVLDIFGFEVFDHNCFEQLCINFANEVLQQHFTKVVFQYELALYEAEGVPCDADVVKVNASIAQERISDSGTLLTRVLSCLDEECNVSGGTSGSWLNKVSSPAVCGSSGVFKLVHHRKGHFVISHFAGPVEYCADAFLAKNRDALAAEALGCMQGSSKTVLQQHFSNHGRTFGTTQSTESGKVLRAKRHTVSSDFRSQLESLMQKIETTCSRFVRCINPNQMGVPHSFDSFLVAEQLRYQGVLEAIRAARVGYGVKLGHKQAVITYWTLAPNKLRLQLEEQLRKGMNYAAAQTLFAHVNETLSEIPPGSVQVGKTFTFFKMESIDILGICVFRRRAFGAVRVQAFVRGLQSARRFRALRGATLLLQRHSRAYAARKLLGALRGAALMLQTHSRAYAARKLLVKLRWELAAARVLQAWWRGKRQRALFQHTVQAAVCVQRWIRVRLRAKGNASAPTEAAQRLIRIRDMVLATLSSLDGLDPENMDSKNNNISDAISSIEQITCTLSHEAELLDLRSRKTSGESPTSSMKSGESHTAETCKVKLPRISPFTPREPETPQAGPWTPQPLGCREMSISDQAVPRTPDKGRPRVRPPDAVPGERDKVCKEDEMHARVPQEKSIHAPGLQRPKRMLYKTIEAHPPPDTPDFGLFSSSWWPWCSCREVSVCRPEDIDQRPGSREVTGVAVVPAEFRPDETAGRSVAVPMVFASVATPIVVASPVLPGKDTETMNMRSPRRSRIQI